VLPRNDKTQEREGETFQVRQR